VSTLENILGRCLQVTAPVRPDEALSDEEYFSDTPSSPSQKKGMRSHRTPPNETEDADVRLTRYNGEDCNIPLPNSTIAY